LGREWHVRERKPSEDLLIASDRPILAGTTYSQPHQKAALRCVGAAAMRYVAAASPAFVARHFAGDVGAGGLAQAPSLVFNTKDELQARWVRRLCHRHVDLPRHTLPSPQAFVTAAVAGMGWGMQLHALITSHLQDGSLVELVPDTPLYVPLYWQHARAASALLDGLSRRVVTAAGRALRPL